MNDELWVLFFASQKCGLAEVCGWCDKSATQVSMLLLYTQPFYLIKSGILFFPPINFPREKWTMKSSNCFS